MTREAITGALALADEVLRWNRLKDLRGCDISPEDRRVLDMQFAAGFSAQADYAPALALALKQAEKHIREMAGFIMENPSSHNNHLVTYAERAGAFLATLKESDNG